MNLTLILSSSKIGFFVTSQNLSYEKDNSITQLYITKFKEVAIRKYSRNNEGVSSGNSLVVEMSCIRIVLFANCPNVKMSCLGTVLPVDCIVVGLSYLGTAVALFSGICLVKNCI